MFAELLSNSAGVDVGQEQAEAHRNFSVRVSQSALQERRPCEAVPGDGTYIVIAVASYSPDELKLLDEVNANSGRWEQKLTIAVFDVQKCRTMADFAKYLPGIGDVYQTPVIAVWKSGKLSSSKISLYWARKLLEQEQVLG